MPLREGLEQRISTLEAEKARDASLLLEAREAYAHLQQQLQATAAAAEAAQAELAFLAPLKEYAGDLQARLKTATASVEDTRAAAEAAKRRAAVAEHECNTQSSRAEAAEARATSLQAQYDELHHDSKNLSDLKQRLEKSFSEERASLAEALRASCGKVDQLEAEVNDLASENAALTKDLDYAREDLDRRRTERGSLVKQVAHKREVEKTVESSRTDIETLRTDNARLLKLLRSTSEWADFQKLWEDSSGVSYVPAAPPPPSRPPPNNRAVSPRSISTAQSPSAPSSSSSSAADDSSSVWVSGDGTSLPVEWFEVNSMAQRYPPDPDPLPNSAAPAPASTAAASASAAISSSLSPSSPSLSAQSSPPPPPPSLPLHAYTPSSYGLVGSALSQETDGWVPHAAATAALRFQTTKLPPGLPAADMHLFLRELNRAWQQREKAHVERLASQFQDEFNEWLRRHEASKPYEMVTAARELRRLKAENKQLRAAKLGVHPATPSRAAGGQETKRRSISGHGQINGRSRNAIMR